MHELSASNFITTQRCLYLDLVFCIPSLHSSAWKDLIQEESSAIQFCFSESGPQSEDSLVIGFEKNFKNESENIRSALSNK